MNGVRLSEQLPSVAKAASVAALCGAAEAAPFQRTMPNHFHLLITPGPLLALERCLQLIKGGFSFRAKKELQFAGEVWEKSFTNHRIRDAVDYAQHRIYIRENLVRAALVSSPEEYAYSSAFPGFELAEAPQGLKPGGVKRPVSHG